MGSFKFLRMTGSKNSLKNLGLKTSMQYPPMVLLVTSSNISVSSFCPSSLTLNDLVSYPSLKDFTQEKDEVLETKEVKGRISCKSVLLYACRILETKEVLAFESKYLFSKSIGRTRPLTCISASLKPFTACIARAGS